MAFHHPAPTAPFLRGIVLALTLAVLPARADSLPRPSGASFAHGAVLTVAGYDAARPALDGFPVLVRISAGSPSGFAYSQLQSPSTGADLVFLDMEGNGLPFEIDTWNPSGESLVWVRLPAMRNGARFAMCWGSSTSGKAVCADNPWDDYVGVWHMNEDAAGITTIHDSTTNALDGTTVTSSSSKTDGKVGRARFITSNKSNTAGNPYDSGVTVDMTGNAAKLAVVDDLVPEFTASFWIRPQDNANWWYFITRKASDVGPGWGLQQGASGDFTKYRAYGGAETDSNCKSFSGVNGLAKGSWTKVDAVWKGDKTFVLYMNGAQAASGTLANQASNGNQTKLSLGGAMAPTDTTKKNGRGVYGDMDEIRLRKGALSADWIAADYATQFHPAFLTVGAAEEIDVAAPAATLSVTGESFTGAVARVRVFALGEGADSATARVEVSATQDFAAPIWAGEAEVAAAGTVDIAATGLAFGTDYWARGIVTNAIGGAVALGPVAFSTPSPGAPEGAAEFVARGYKTLSALGVPLSFGAGATSATMRLEASTNAAFATIDGVSAEVPTTLQTENTLVVSNLLPGVEYRLRLRLANDWGLETFVELPDAVTTLDGPFDATGLRWTFSPDVTLVDVSFNVTAVFDGATGTATLYCDEGDVPTTSRGARTITAPGTLTWADIPFGDDALHAKIVLASEVDGTPYEQVWDAVVDLAFKRPKLVSSATLATALSPEGTNIASDVSSVFDGDFATGVFSAAAGDAIVVDFSSLLDTNKPSQRIYVGDILVAHGTACPYSLYVTGDGETWTVLDGAANAISTGTARHSVKDWVKAVKYVFESDRTSGSDPLLAELQVYGYVSDSPHVVSKSELAWIYKTDGTACSPDSSDPTQPTATGGGSYMRDLFNGNFDDNVYLGPNGRLWDGAYCILDFSSEMPGGWFVTEIRTGSKTTHKYSLYYSMDGSRWTAVESGINVEAVGQKTFSVNDTAVYVKCVFNKIGGWTPTFNELQVWGMDPADVACMHPEWSDWAPVAGSATCTEYGVDEQFCTTCGERVTRENRSLTPLGHEFFSRLDRPGKFRRFGQGAFGCTRCDFLVDCPEPVNLITNEVNGSRIGIVQTTGLFPFTTVTVTSTGQSGYGVRPGHLVSDTWTWAWNNYWFSTDNDTDAHVDYLFGTDVDLTWIDVSLPNATHVVRFFSVDPVTGAETQLRKFKIERTDLTLGDEFHVWRSPDDPPYEDPYGDGFFNHLIVTKDSGIPEHKRDENGAEILEEKDGQQQPVTNGYNQYQRFTVRFFEQPVRHLRIRQYGQDGESYRRPMQVSELHPWGTVPGAGDWPYEKTSVVIYR